MSGTSPRCSMVALSKTSLKQGPVNVRGPRRQSIIHGMESREKELREIIQNTKKRQSTSVQRRGSLFGSSPKTVPPSLEEKVFNDQEACEDQLQSTKSITEEYEKQMQNIQEAQDDRFSIDELNETFNDSRSSKTAIRKSYAYNSAHGARDRSSFSSLRRGSVLSNKILMEQAWEQRGSGSGAPSTGVSRGERRMSIARAITASTPGISHSPITAAKRLSRSNFQSRNNTANAETRARTSAMSQQSAASDEYSCDSSVVAGEHQEEIITNPYVQKVGVIDQDEVDFYVKTGIEPGTSYVSRAPTEKGDASSGCLAAFCCVVRPSNKIHQSQKLNEYHFESDDEIDEEEVVDRDDQPNGQENTKSDTKKEAAPILSFTRASMTSTREFFRMSLSRNSVARKKSIGKNNGAKSPSASITNCSSMIERSHALGGRKSEIKDKLDASRSRELARNKSQNSNRQRNSEINVRKSQLESRLSQISQVGRPSKISQGLASVDYIN